MSDSLARGYIRFALLMPFREVSINKKRTRVYYRSAGAWRTLPLQEIHTHWEQNFYGFLLSGVIGWAAYFS